ncbi:MAG: XRE family transcriptional regulator [Spirochaetes bacterium]|jgi:transcriptional regulator with XRE-family HTH domain|nr:MAG: XRE family transcriptional regulator [Spirochaetota bacterium]
MGRRAIEAGPTSETVADNLARFRRLRGLTLAELSARMTEVGRPMTGNTLSAIENRSRRADVDDLVVLAAVLNVSPASLLMPYLDPSTKGEHGDPSLVHATVPSSVFTEPVAAGRLWNWLNTSMPLDIPKYGDQVDSFEVERWRRDQVPGFAWNTSHTATNTGE